MLEAYALKYIELGGEIEKVRVAFAETFACGQDQLSAPDRESLRLTLGELAKLSADLELPIAVQTVRHAEFDLPRTMRELDQLIHGVFAELKSRKLFYVPAHLSMYYESDSLISEKVTDAFPASVSRNKRCR